MEGGLVVHTYRVRLVSAVSLRLTEDSTQDILCYEMGYSNTQDIPLLFYNENGVTKKRETGKVHTFRYTTQGLMVIHIQALPI